MRFKPLKSMEIDEYRLLIVYQRNIRHQGRTYDNNLAARAVSSQASNGNFRTRSCDAHDAYAYDAYDACTYYRPYARVTLEMY